MRRSSTASRTTTGKSRSRNTLSGLLYGGVFIFLWMRLWFSFICRLVSLIFFFVCLSLSISSSFWYIYLQSLLSGNCFCSSLWFFFFQFYFANLSLVFVFADCSLRPSSSSVFFPFSRIVNRFLNWGPRLRGPRESRLKVDDDLVSSS